MKALIFAAGLGTRLYPLTRSCPKALVEVGGVPMLQRVIENVKKVGIKDIVVNVHHYADMIIDFLGANDYFGTNIQISDERGQLLETGGGLLKARNFLDGHEDILLHNADILTDLDLSRIALADGSQASLLVSNRQSSRQLVFDGRSNLLEGWINQSNGEIRPQGFVINPQTHILRSFNGIHVISPSLFPVLERYSAEIGSAAFSITPFYIYCASEGLRISGADLRDYNWFDIGRPASLAAAQLFLSSGN